MLLLLNKTTGYNLALAGVKLEWFIISLINKCSKMNKSLMNKAQFFSVIFIVAWLILSFFNGVAPYLWPEIDFSIIYLIRGSLNIFVNILISIWIISSKA